jgi:hypothetical protein
MKRIYLASVIAALSLVLCCMAPAQMGQMGQMGMSMWQKIAIAKYMNPVVGKGAVYEVTNMSSRDNSPKSMEMGVVGKDGVDGKDGFWMQMVMATARGQMVSKTLMTRDDFQSHKTIFQMQGQQAMEMTINPSAARDVNVQDNMKEWHSAGTETITVPAGTFTCEHWKNDTKGSELWLSDKVTPFGLVKETSKDNSMVLTKVLSDVTDKITGPVTKFDMQQMMQQMQQQHQKP